MAREQQETCRPLLALCFLLLFLSKREEIERGRKMEKKKKSLVEELFPRREAAPQQAKYDILTSIFPQHPMVDGKCSSHSEWKYSSLDAKTHGSSGKNHSSAIGNGNPIYLCELPETCLMSSSVHYGGRDDFIPESSSTNAGMPCNPRKNEEDESGNSDVAIRGDWWLGSYYY